MLLVARTREAWLELRRQFRARKVGKRYLALVVGTVAKPGEITRPIAPDRRRRGRVRVVGEATPRARAAITRFRPLGRYRDATLLEIDLVTGVMHQIRAHLASIGHPVVGDRRYGGSSDAPRQLLHAAALDVAHPLSGERLRIESPLPEDFAAALARYQAPVPSTGA